MENKILKKGLIAQSNVSEGSSSWFGFDSRFVYLLTARHEGNYAFMWYFMSSSYTKKASALFYALVEK